MNISLFEDGECIYHLELERLYNIKHYGDFVNGKDSREMYESLLPTFFDHVLPTVGWSLDEIDAICIDTIQWFMNLYPDPALRDCLGRLYYSTDPRHAHDRTRRHYAGRDRDFFVTMHHVAHEAYAYYTGPFDDALIVAYDGIGEFDINTSWAVGEGNRLRHAGDFTHRRPEGIDQNSIGFVYSFLGGIFTFMYGNTNDSPGKAMGLSSYGAPVDVWRGPVRDLLRGYVRQWHDITHNPIGPLCGISLEELHNPQSQRARDLMATFQDEAELYMVETVGKLVDLTGKRNLCLVGGCALNVQVNSRLLDEGVVDRIHVPPACSDTGLAIGTGLLYWHEALGNPFTPKPYHTPYLGDVVANLDCLQEHDLKVTQINNEAALCRSVARMLAAGRTVGWAQGRSEIGPRALGNRSILADPRSPFMKDRINHEIKHRDYWRPFAPVCLAERASEWFETTEDSPYMLLAPRVRPEKRDLIPAVTHVDGTARLQTVRQEQNPILYRLLRAFEEETGCPILLNTSLNDKGCPIANEGNIILEFLRKSGLQVAVLGNRIYQRNKVVPILA